jgi:L-threonylcarbamoyladenylate synthase
VTGFSATNSQGSAPDLIDAEHASGLHLLTSGGVIAIPTDTVYGLAASLSFPDAVERIYRIKGRSLDKALPILVNSPELLDYFGHNVSATARRLAAEFWPGPLTIVVEASKNVPPVVTRGLSTVGLRMPANALTLRIIAAAGGAIAVTSANLSGDPEARSAEEASARLGRLVDGVIDGGPAPADAPSTVIDTTEECVRILRVGALDPILVQRCLGDVA